MRRVVLLCGAVAIATLLVSACKPIPPGSPNAPISTAGISGNGIVFQAGSGGANRISVYGGYSYDVYTGAVTRGPFTFIEDSAGYTINPGSGCERGENSAGAPQANKVKCRYDLGVTAYLGDGADTATMTYGTRCAALGLSNCWPKYGATFYGGPGNDTLSGWNSRQYGEGGNDKLNGGDGAEKLDGGDGDDVLRGGPANDTLECGAGIDWVSYHDSPAGVSVTIGGTGSGGHAQGDVIGNSCENVGGTGFNDTIIGNGANNRVHGEGGNDRIEGKGGNDVLVGYAGDDIIVGGAGADTIECNDGVDWASYYDSPGPVQVVLGGTGIGADAQGDVIAAACENAGGTAYNDILVGNDRNNRLHGEPGNDKLYGGPGNDYLEGHLGDDELDGGMGADQLVCGNGGGDFVSYRNAGGNVKVTIGGIGEWADAAGDRVDASCEGIDGSPYNDELYGNAAANRLRGFEGNDIFYGYGGNDTLDGGAGSDALNGGPGADTLVCGPQPDHVSYWNSPGGVSVTIGGQSSGADAQGDQVSSTCEQVDGSPYNDTLVGTNNNDTLKGFDGNDTIWALRGVDTVYGGNGDDAIVTSGDSEDGSHDYIDCGAGNDTLDADKDNRAGCENTGGKKALTVYLVHGYDWTGEVGTPGDSSCSSQWDTLKSILRNSGWTGPIRTVGYYVDDTNCDVKLPGTNTNNTPIEDLSKKLAQKIYEQHGNQPVNVVGFSMGGMIIRRMMMERLKGTAGYPAINIANLVTVQSPLAGSTVANAVPDSLCSVQCRSLRTNSPFVQWFANNDWVGTGTTDVTEISSDADAIVRPSSSAYAWTAQHKVLYSNSVGYGHVFGRSYNDSGSVWNLSISYLDKPSVTWRSWGTAPRGGNLIFEALKSTAW